ncbi:MAG TPA: phosphatidylglycerophosphatase A [Candidatus Angelobacter sp.]|nr:phosphatidylglycerophosphatase A [Candidatus Angelobacter sp.]
MNTKTDAAPAEPPRKPRLSLFFATAGGVGYLPKAPGTWGSLVGALLYWAVCRFSPTRLDAYWWGAYYAQPVPSWAIPLALLIALIGVAVSARVAKFLRQKDPQFVVIDEVSGQFFTYLMALAPLNWKYLLLGFILFRVFDIWKPFPARQAESLPGGWGIMADDWAAAVYAAIGIWIARGLGL